MERDNTTFILAIIGAAAWLSPLVVWGFQKLIRPKVEFYPAADNLDLGFGFIGPILMVRGSLRAIKKSCFVSLMKAVVRNIETGETHEFRWLWFNEEQMIFGSGTAGETNANLLKTSAAAGVQVNITKAEDLFITFRDYQTFKKVQEITIEFSSKLQSKFQERILKGSPQASPKDDSTETITPENIDELIRQRLFTDPDLLALRERLIDNCFYWKRGRYEVQFEIEIANSKLKFQTLRKFQISNSQSESLKNNKESILFIPTRLVPNPKYNTVSTELDVDLNDQIS